jgi:4-hydroxy-4-methyl-2-oxoglutarate aldolase
VTDQPIASRVSRSLTQRLLSLDTCVVSDALDAAGLRGVTSGLRPFTRRNRIAGRVQTVHIGPSRGALGRRHLGTAAIEAAQPGDIIAIASGREVAAASWGGLLSAAAVQQGVAGVIIDGAARDIDEAEELGFPIYARAGVCRTARRRLEELDWNQPVTIGDVQVAPGDFALADGSGVLFLAQNFAEDVIVAAEGLVRREQTILSQIRAGVPASQAMSGGYESMLEGEQESHRHE